MLKANYAFNFKIMPVKVFSCLVQGLEGKLVEVEADILQGLSAFTIVGLGDTSVQESKERIRSAIKNTEAKYPPQKKIINLAPASLRKQGPAFDLAMAIAILAASGQIPESVLRQSLFMGELALDGAVKPISNIISVALFARKEGWKKLFVPMDNWVEASLVTGLEIVPVKHLQELYLQLTGRETIKIDQEILAQRSQGKEVDVSFDLNLIQGQEMAKRAIQIAAAGGHHLLLYGPPGVGKTMIARALAEILPDLSEQERFETMQIYSAAGKINPLDPMITSRPFRQIHQSASMVSLTGGGSPIKPGEISLAHNGVLFVDEIAEFPRSSLEALRQPLEEKIIHLSRQGQQISLPCNFALVAAMNPCPCGHFGDTEKACSCSPQAIANYRKKVSGPIFDRIDLTVPLNKPKFSLLQITNPEFDPEKIGQIRKSISEARRRQIARYQGTEIANNAGLNSHNIGKYLRLAPNAREYLEIITEKTNLSVRAHLHLIKTSLTIADLKAQNEITNIELAEAFQYRNPNLFEKVFG